MASVPPKISGLWQGDMLPVWCFFALATLRLWADLTLEPSPRERGRSSKTSRPFCAQKDCCVSREGTYFPVVNPYCGLGCPSGFPFISLAAPSEIPPTPQSPWLPLGFPCGFPVASGTAPFGSSLRLSVRGSRSGHPPPNLWALRW